MSKHEHVTIRIWTETRHMLRLLSAYMGKPMIEILHWLVKQEWNRRDKEGDQWESTEDQS